MYNRNPRDYLPDVKDGLTYRERIVLQCLYDLQQECLGRNVPTGMLYGTVVEYVDRSVDAEYSGAAGWAGMTIMRRSISCPGRKTKGEWLRYSESKQVNDFPQYPGRHYDNIMPTCKPILPSLSKQR